jgi:hypothetical protein
MTDDQLRALVRDAIARHMGGATSRPLTGPEEPLPQALPRDPRPTVVAAHAPGGVAIAVGPGAMVHVHVSHATFELPTLSDGVGEGPCHVEPSTSCNKCGFCQSYGF